MFVCVFIQKKPPSVRPPWRARQQRKAPFPFPFPPPPPPTLSPLSQRIPDAGLRSVLWSKKAAATTHIFFSYQGHWRERERRYGMRNNDPPSGGGEKGEGKGLGRYDDVRTNRWIERWMLLSSWLFAVFVSQRERKILDRNAQWKFPVRISITINFSACWSCTWPWRAFL